MTAIRLSHSGIEYVLNPDGSRGYAWGLHSGCRHDKEICAVSDHCWARSITNHFPAHYPNGWEPTFYPEAFLSPLSIKKPSTFTVGWMGDMFGDWVDPNTIYTLPSGLSVSLQKCIDDVCEACPQHRLLFLTKNPKGYLKWGKFPDTAWCGATVCNQADVENRLPELCKVDAGGLWVSIEPLLGHIDLSPYLSRPVPGASWYEDDKGVERYDLNGAPLNGIRWVVIGGQTRPTVLPKIEWVREIAEACDAAGIAVWLKNNLWSLFPEKTAHLWKEWAVNSEGSLRHEFPMQLKERA